MIKGIQITQAANDNLLNSFWLLDSEKNEARCLCAKAEFCLLYTSYPSITHKVIHNRVNMPIRLIKKRIYETICKSFLYKI